MWFLKGLFRVFFYFGIEWISGGVSLGFRVIFVLRCFFGSYSNSYY